MIWVWMALSWGVIWFIVAWALCQKLDEESLELPRAKSVEHVRIVHKKAS